MLTVRLLAAVTLLLVLVVPALAQDQGRPGRTLDSGRLFAAGDDVRVVDGAADDAFVAGRRLNLLGSYAQNAFAAGGDVIVTGTIARSVFAAGNFVSIEGRVGHDLFAAGRTIRIQEGAEVAGIAFLAGTTVDIAGRVGGNVRAAGGTVVINGTVTGDVTVYGGSLRVAPGARIGGTLRYSTDTAADISPGASVGSVQVLPPPSVPHPETVGTVAVRFVWLVCVAVAFTILAAILHLAIPGLLTSGAETFSARPLGSFGLGLALTIGLPVAGVLLLITLVGIPLALLLWVFGAVLYGLGTATSAYWIGLRLRSFVTTSLQDPYFWGRTLWTAIGFLLLGLLAWAPWVGGLLVWIIGTIATGAVFHAMWVRFRAPPPVSAHI